MRLVAQAGDSPIYCLPFPSLVLSIYIIHIKSYVANTKLTGISLLAMDTNKDHDSALENVRKAQARLAEALRLLETSPTAESDNASSRSNEVSQVELTNATLEDHPESEPPAVSSQKAAFTSRIILTYVATSLESASANLALIVKHIPKADRD